MTQELCDAVNTMLNSELCEDEAFVDLMSAMWGKLYNYPNNDDIEEVVDALGEFVPSTYTEER